MNELKVAKNFDGNGWWSTEPVYLTLCLERGLAHRHRASWTTEKGLVDKIDALSPIWSERTAIASEAIVEIEAGLALVDVSTEGSVSAVISQASASEITRKESIAYIKSVLPEGNPHSRHELEFSFLSMGHDRAGTTIRMLPVPEWNSMSQNYSSNTAGRLNSLVRRKSPPEGGSFLLWHGEAGTGKTHALRALAWEWREWCDFEFVVDPENFFSNSSYMLDGLLSGVSMRRIREGRWSVLVMEDTGELLAVDAKRSVGQSLSRFLNLTDGVLGEGLNRMILLTTNEPLSTLHPAVSRPGRCSSIIEFSKLPASEADAWLRESGVPNQGRSLTVAELFALRRGEEARPKPSKQMGFGSNAVKAGSSV